MKVKYFARLRELTNTDEDIFQVSGEQTILSVIQKVKEKHPSIENEKNLLIAINEKYANLSDPVTDSDVVAIFPPVSGG